MTYDDRPLGPEHAEEWQALRLEGTRDFPLGFLITETEAAQATPKRCRKILAAGTTRGGVASDRLAGYCGFRPEQLVRTQHRAEIGPFLVARSHQGRGAADVLMRGVIAEARTLGLAQLELFVDTGNRRALAFYERHGFERAALFPDGVRIDGRSHDAHWCRLRLEN